MPALRVAFFNVENLFARARVLNTANADADPSWLDRVSALQKELARESYAGREDNILRLARKVQGYAEISEERDSLFRRNFRGDIVGLRASGRHDWDGSLRLKDSPLSEQNRANTARVINEIAPDIMGLAEVESRRILTRFDREMLDRRYPYAMLIDGNDERGIDVGILSRFPIVAVRSHVFDEANGRRIFHRDCLEVDIAIPGGTPLTALVAHLKSRRKSRPGEIDADTIRKEEARRVATILQGLQPAQRQVIFMGDLNDRKEREPYALRPLWGVADMAEVFEARQPTATERELWTFHYPPEDRYEKIDYLFASKPLLARLGQAGIERRGIFNLAGLTAGAAASFDSVSRAEDAASDHAAIWAEFDLA